MFFIGSLRIVYVRGINKGWQSFYSTTYSSMSRHINHLHNERIKILNDDPIAANKRNLQLAIDLARFKLKAKTLAIKYGRLNKQCNQPLHNSAFMMEAARSFIMSTITNNTE